METLDQQNLRNSNSKTRVLKRETKGRQRWSGKLDSHLKKIFSTRQPHTSTRPKLDCLLQKIPSAKQWDSNWRTSTSASSNSTVPTSKPTSEWFHTAWTSKVKLLKSPTPIPSFVTSSDSSKRCKASEAEQLTSKRQRNVCKRSHLPLLFRLDEDVALCMKSVVRPTTAHTSLWIRRSLLPDNSTSDRNPRYWLIVKECSSAKISKRNWEMSSWPSRSRTTASLNRPRPRSSLKCWKTPKSKRSWTPNQTTLPTSKSTETTSRRRIPKFSSPVN